MPEACDIKCTLCDCMQKLMGSLLCNGLTHRNAIRHHLTVPTRAPASTVAGGKLDWRRLYVLSVEQ